MKLRLEVGVAAGKASSRARVSWITGLSSAGKTTLGKALWHRLHAAGRSAVFLDGDALREVIAEDLTHNICDRRHSAMRNARLCRLLASQGAHGGLGHDRDNLSDACLDGAARVIIYFTRNRCAWLVHANVGLISKRYTC